MAENFDVIVLGGGAAGLMCAIEAGKRGRNVLVLERAEKIGKKVLISGGGRCNFTNLDCTPENFLSANPHFAKSALARYTPSDFIRLVEKHKIAYHEKTLGQLFCDGPAQAIVTMLEVECAAAKVEIRVNAKVTSVDRSGMFLLHASDQQFSCESLVVATGGLSIPKMGATDFGLKVAEQFGLNLQPCRPALVPLVFHPQEQQHFADLAGTSAEVVASVPGQSFREKMLFTHRGVSGPAILQISSYWPPGVPIDIDLAPERDLTSTLRETNSGRDLNKLSLALRAVLTRRLADRWLELHAPKGWSNRALEEFERQFHHWSVSPAGTEGYAKAEVTAGGVDTDELSAKTMECSKAPGLYFIGEVVDVTGQLGGFNFQWAWASGHSAGQAV